ncbi:hypothetical protein [Desulfuribacillus alkaliarsenatis]|nr:hypothetical protein [Desulfuribacillus alkaliarsenatis]
MNKQTQNVSLGKQKAKSSRIVKSKGKKTAIKTKPKSTKDKSISNQQVSTESVSNALNNVSNIDTVTIKNVHNITKELITTLYTVEKSLLLLNKLISIMDNYKINLNSLNKTELSGVLKKLNLEQLDKAVHLLQKPEIIGLLNSLKSSTESEQNKQV